jgi:hypothetical protein
MKGGIDLKELNILIIIYMALYKMLGLSTLRKNFKSCKIELISINNHYLHHSMRMDQRFR